MNCVVGDMAVIRSVPGIVPKNIGAIVDVKYPCGEHPQLGKMWLVVGRLPLLGIDGKENRIGIISDRALQPIRGPKSQQQTKTATPITEVTPA